MFHFVPKNAMPDSVRLTDRSDRCRIEVTGPDRAKFLHNLTTTTSSGWLGDEAARRSSPAPQGKTIGYVIILASEDRILVTADPDGMAWLCPIFASTGSSTTSRSSIARGDVRAPPVGAGADELVRRVGGPMPGTRGIRACSAEVGGCAVRVIRESPAGLPGLTGSAIARTRARVVEALGAAGQPGESTELDPSAFENA